MGIPKEQSTSIPRAGSCGYPIAMHRVKEKKVKFLGEFNFDIASQSLHLPHLKSCHTHEPTESSNRHPFNPLGDPQGFWAPTAPNTRH
jgi:hypothetical protein